jgi:hypothetical protein
MRVGTAPAPAPRGAGCPFGPETPDIFELGMETPDIFASMSSMDMGAAAGAAAGAGAGGGAGAAGPPLMPSIDISMLPPWQEGQ